MSYATSNGTYRGPDAWVSPQSTADPAIAHDDPFVPQSLDEMDEMQAGLIRSIAEITAQLAFRAEEFHLRRVKGEDIPYDEYASYRRWKVKAEAARRHKQASSKILATRISRTLRAESCNVAL